MVASFPNVTFISSVVSGDHNLTSQQKLSLSAAVFLISERDLSQTQVSQHATKSVSLSVSTKRIQTYEHTVKDETEHAGVSREGNTRLCHLDIIQASEYKYYVRITPTIWKDGTNNRVTHNVSLHR